LGSGGLMTTLTFNRGVPALEDAPLPSFFFCSSIGAQLVQA
jgi:hypothetical protein